MKKYLVVASFVLVGFSFGFGAEAATFDLAQTYGSQTHSQVLNITKTQWTLSKKDKNEITFTLTNSSTNMVSGEYTIVITRLSDASKPVYEKTSKLKNLKAGAEKKIKVGLHKSAIYKKLKEGSYNVELFVNDIFVASTVVGITKKSSQTATVRVWTSADGLQLPSGGALTVYAEVNGSLPKGGRVDLGIATKEKNGTISSWYPVPSQVIKEDFSGTQTVSVVIPYNYAPYGPYTLGDDHYAFARLFPGTSIGSSATYISDASAPTWFFTR